KCRCGASMTSHYAAKGNRRYSSYVCSLLQKQGKAACPGSRISVRQIEQFVLERVRAVGRDPGLVAEAVAAARPQVGARRAALAAERARAAAARRRLEAERATLVAVVGAGADAPAAIVERLAQVDREVADLDARGQALQAERSSLDGAAVDEADLRAAL